LIGRIIEAMGERKCRLALESIARRYRAMMRHGYGTDWPSAFLMACDPSFDWPAAGGRLLCTAGPGN
jgi:hypothetical protein